MRKTNRQAGKIDRNKQGLDLLALGTVDAISLSLLLVFIAAIPRSQLNLRAAILMAAPGFISLSAVVAGVRIIAQSQRGDTGKPERTATIQNWPYP